MPRKVFTGGSILQAAEVNTFLMDQAVMVFDDATARNTAIPTPIQGMVTFLKDLNVLEAWFGDRWGQVSGAGSITVSETAPTGPEVEDGALWFNSVLGRTFIYYEDDDSAQWVEIGAGSGPTAAAVFTSAPASAELGQLWFDSETGNLYFYYVDSDSAQWIQVRSAAPVAEPAAEPAGPSGLFYKADSNSVAFTAPTGSTVSIKAGTKVEIDGTVVDFATATAVTMPSLTAGSDYYIYAKSDGSAEAVLAMGIWPAPVASPPANSRLIGGFHFALGGNAPAQNGGDRVPVINPFSFWDLKWRPVALDPRGMTLVANRFWSDIYLLNRDPDQFGTSRAGQPIADGQTGGTTTAIVPAAFGGNGSTRYPVQSWWNTAECLSAYGKRLPRYSEFASLAYGVKENHSVNSDPVDTGLINGSGSGSGRDTNAERYTSKWGVIQATGTMWVWGDEFGGGNAAASWANINGGRGNVFQQENAVRLGAAWNNTVDAGSRSSAWPNSPSYSFTIIGGRGVCDHLSLA